MQLQVNDQVQFKASVPEVFLKHGFGQVVPYRGEHNPENPRVRWESGWAFHVSSDQLEKLNFQVPIQICEIDK